MASFLYATRERGTEGVRHAGQRLNLCRGTSVC